MLQEFKKFAMRGSVVDLAIGVIIGAAFGKINRRGKEHGFQYRGDRLKINLMQVPLRHSEDPALSPLHPATFQEEMAS